MAAYQLVKIPDILTSLFNNCYGSLVKIVQVIARDNRGGTARWLEQLVIGLRANGHEVLLLAGSVQEGESEDLSFKKLGGIRVPGLGRKISLTSDLQAIFFLRKFIKSTNPDILNTHTAKAGLIGRLAALSLFFNRPKIVHTFHGHLLYGYFSNKVTKLIIIIERILASKTDLLLAAGEQVRDDLIKVGIGSDKKFQVMRPGIPPFNLIGKTEAKKNLGIDQNVIVIGWLGRLTSIKRPDRVLEIAKLFPNQIFLIGGEGELRKDLEEVATLNVKFLGWTSPEIIWSTSDVALLTSENEAQPISLIEASFASLPIVTQDVGSVDEVVLNNKTGFLVDNLNGFQEKLNYLIANDSIRLEMGTAAKKFSEERFGVVQFINGHEAAYSAFFQ